MRVALRTDRVGEPARVVCRSAHFVGQRLLVHRFRRSARMVGGEVHGVRGLVRPLRGQLGVRDVHRRRGRRWRERGRNRRRGAGRERRRWRRGSRELRPGVRRPAGSELGGCHCGTGGRRRAGRRDDHERRERRERRSQRLRGVHVLWRRSGGRRRGFRLQRRRRGVLRSQRSTSRRERRWGPRRGARGIGGRERRAPVHHLRRRWRWRRGLLYAPWEGEPCGLAGLWRNLYGTPWSERPLRLRRRRRVGVPLRRRGGWRGRRERLRVGICRRERRAEHRWRRGRGRGILLQHDRLWGAPGRVGGRRRVGPGGRLLSGVKATWRLGRPRWSQRRNALSPPRPASRMGRRSRPPGGS